MSDEDLQQECVVSDVAAEVLMNALWLDLCLITGRSASKVASWARWEASNSSG